MLIKESRKWMENELAGIVGKIDNADLNEDEALKLYRNAAMLERRLAHVFPFFHSEAVHWHAARFRKYLIS